MRSTLLGCFGLQKQVSLCFAISSSLSNGWRGTLSVVNKRVHSTTSSSEPTKNTEDPRSDKATDGSSATPGRVEWIKPELKEELSKSYFWERNELARDPKGKLFKATPVRPGKAVIPSEIPNLIDIGGAPHSSVSSLFTYSPCTLLVVSLQRPYCYESMIKGWEEEYAARYKEKANVVEFVFLEKWLNQKLGFFYRFLAKRMSLRSVRIFHSLSFPSSIKSLFSIQNTYVGYVYLVDKEMNIRWRAVGAAEPEELAQLFHIADSLLQPH